MDAGSEQSPPPPLFLGKYPSKLKVMRRQLCLHLPIRPVRLLISCFRIRVAEKVGVRVGVRDGVRRRDMRCEM